MNQTLYDELVAERFGPRSETEKERPPTPAEINRRRRVLNGDEEKRE